MIRKAKKEDLSRIAEILVFAKRMKYRPIFQNDDYSFGELQVIPVAEQYSSPDILGNIWFTGLLTFAIIVVIWFVFGGWEDIWDEYLWFYF